LTDENRVPLQSESTGTGGNVQTITNGNQSCLQTQYNVRVDSCIPSHSILHQQSSPVSGSMSPFASSIQSSMGHQPLLPLSPFAFNVPLNFSYDQTPPLYGCSPSPCICVVLTYVLHFLVSTPGVSTTELSSIECSRKAFFSLV